jgi:hypothetical protein
MPPGAVPSFAALPFAGRRAGVSSHGPGRIAIAGMSAPPGSAPEADCPSREPRPHPAGRVTTGRWGAGAGGAPPEGPPSRGRGAGGAPGRSACGPGGSLRGSRA